jgi:hypothetical protein
VAYSNSDKCSKLLQTFIDAGISVILPNGTSKKSALDIAIKNANPVTFKMLLNFDKNILILNLDVLNNAMLDLLQRRNELEASIKDGDQRELLRINEIIDFLAKNKVVASFDKEAMGKRTDNKPPRLSSKKGPQIKYDTSHIAEIESGLVAENPDFNGFNNSESKPEHHNNSKHT